jgi:hypothetical protein
MRCGRDRRACQADPLLKYFFEAVSKCKKTREA